MKKLVETHKEEVNQLKGRVKELTDENLSLTQMVGGGSTSHPQPDPTLFEFDANRTQPTSGTYFQPVAANFKFGSEQARKDFIARRKSQFLREKNKIEMRIRDKPAWERWKLWIEPLLENYKDLEEWGELELDDYSPGAIGMVEPAPSSESSGSLSSDITAIIPKRKSKQDPKKKGKDPKK